MSAAAPAMTAARSTSGYDRGDGLSREVYCILGVPIDVTDMQTAVRCVEEAADRGQPFLVSTPNLNFIVNSLSDSEFRDSLIASDLCTADGIAVVILARLLGVPVRRRVSGSDFLTALRNRKRPERSIRVFLFGGATGVAEIAGKSVNGRAGGVRCVGWLSPGFGSVDDMSGAEMIDAINASNADFLIAALGASKGQRWLMRNHDRITVPVRAHLGAALNFEAGTVRRAPRSVQRFGLEWAWRIFQEPRLLPRYVNDGGVLVALLLGKVLPLFVLRHWSELRTRLASNPFEIQQIQERDSLTLRIRGVATHANASEIASAFRQALEFGGPIRIDLEKATYMDSRFLGLVLVLRKAAGANGYSVSLSGMSPKMRSLARLHCAEHLVTSLDGAGRLRDKPIYS